MKFFIDTCVWRDFYEDRIGKKGKTLGKDAAELFKFIFKHKHTILFSEFISHELKAKYNNKEIETMLGLLNTIGILKPITHTKYQKKEAKDISNKRTIPFVDCLYAITARDNNATLVIQDKHLLHDLKDIITAKRPHDAIKENHLNYS